MGALLVLVFIVVPILEIVVFIQAGQWIGLWPTLAAIVLTALIGAALVRHQGLSTLQRAQQSLAEGRFPIAEVFEGLCIVFAGALLITPGFITDTAGFLLLVPSVRVLLRRLVGRRMIDSGRVTVWTDAPPPPGHGRGGVVIDAEYEHVDDSDSADRPAAEPPAEAPPRRAAPERGGSPWRRGGMGGDPRDD